MPYIHIFHLCFYEVNVINFQFHIVLFQKIISYVKTDHKFSFSLYLRIMCMYVRVCLYARTHTYTYIYIYMHIYICY